MNEKSRKLLDQALSLNGIDRFRIIYDLFYETIRDGEYTVSHLSEIVSAFKGCEDAGTLRTILINLKSFKNEEFLKNDIDDLVSRLKEITGAKYV